VETRGSIYNIAEKNVDRDLLYEMPAKSDLRKTAWINRMDGALLNSLRKNRKRVILTTVTSSKCQCDAE